MSNAISISQISKSSIDHEELLKYVRKSYTRPAQTIATGFLALLIAAIIGIIYTSTTNILGDPNKVIGLVLALLIIAGFIFITPIVFGRFSDAMFPDLVGPKYTEICRKYIDHYDDIALAHELKMAESEQSTLQTSTLLPNLMWAGLIAIIAFTNQIQWFTPGGVIAALFLILVIILVTISAITNVERSYANTVIIKAIIGTQQRRERRITELRNQAVLQELLRRG